MTLSSFRDLPDLLAADSIEASETVCPCCSDAAAFLGALSYIELVQPGEPAIAAIHRTAEDFGDSWDVYLHPLRKNGPPTACLFQCLHCGKYRGYNDSN